MIFTSKWFFWNLYFANEEVMAPKSKYVNLYPYLLKNSESFPVPSPYSRILSTLDFLSKIFKINSLIKSFLI